jgi:hypothetical protein
MGLVWQAGDRSSCATIENETRVMKPKIEMDEIEKLDAGLRT